MKYLDLDAAAKLIGMEEYECCVFCYVGSWLDVVICYVVVILCGLHTQYGSLVSSSKLVVFAILDSLGVENSNTRNYFESDS